MSVTLHHNQNDILCEECFNIINGLSCCYICSHVICNNCTSDILCEKESYNTKPCYKCTALILVPRLKKEHILLLNKYFLEEIVKFYQPSEDNQAYSSVEQMANFLVSKKLATIKLHFYYILWDRILKYQNESVRAVVFIYNSYGHSFIENLNLNYKLEYRNSFQIVDPNKEFQFPCLDKAPRKYHSQSPLGEHIIEEPPTNSRFSNFRRIGRSIKRISSQFFDSSSK